MSDSLKINVVSQSETGRRSANDDCVFVDRQIGLSIVCDGARGRFGGRTAAELAVQTIQSYVANIDQFVGNRITPQAEQYISEMLGAAHQRILAAQASDSSLRGMASTAAVVLDRGSEVLISHMGDSRVYIYRDPKLQLLTRDHNLENYLKDNPNLRPKAKMSGKTLMRALGAQNPKLDVSHKKLRIQKDDLILICSDGLTDSVPPLTAREILAGVKVLPLEEVAASLIRAAISHGSMDNISVVLLQVTDKDPDAPRTMIYETDRAQTVMVVGWLIFLEGPQKGRLIPLEASTVIGADTGCRVSILEPYASGRHAEVYRTETGFNLRDLKSTNGTFINNIQATENCLVDNDVIRVGTTEIVFKCHLMEMHLD